MNGPPPPSRKNRLPAVNSPSGLLSDAENDTIFSMLGKKCFTLATCVVQVYLAEGSGREWQKRCTGVVCFVKDNPMRSYYIRVYSLRNHSKVWEQELYNQFKYSTPRSYFHTFDTDKCRAGLNFASESEAHKFHNVVEEKIRQKQERRTAKVRSPSIRTPTSPRPGPGQNHPPSNTPSYNTASRPSVNHTVIDNKQPPKVDNKKDKKKGKNKKKKLSKTDIGSPSGFQHVGHVGWDPNKGFDMNNMDPDVKDLFANAGITEKDMEDKEKAQFIYDFIEKQGGIEAVKKDRSTRAPPPPPPSRGGRGSLPPPPPSRSNNHPPPPQSRRHDNNRRDGPPPPPQRQSGGVPPPPPQNQHKPRPQQQFQPPPPLSGSIPSPPSFSSIPPPPMKLGGGGALPPPPSQPASGGGRGALLSQIHKGAKLKSSGDRPNNPPPSNKGGGGGGGRGALLDAIRKGAALNKVSQDQVEKQAPPEEEEDGLAGALARALHNRAKDIHTDSESSDAEDSEDEWSD